MDNEEPINLRAHHIANLAYYYFTNFADFWWFHDNKRTEFNKHFFSTFQILAANMNSKVKVASGIEDFFCSGVPLCPNKEDGCEKPGRDDICLKRYGLEIGEVYSVEQLISIAIDYACSSGFVTPIGELVGRRDW